MKNKGLLLFVMSLLVLISNSTDLTAQKFYISVDGGYSARSLAVQHRFIASSTEIIGSDQTYTISKRSLGNGLQSGLSFSYKLTDNIGAEVTVSYFNGATFEFTSKYVNQNMSIYSDQYYQQEGNLVRLNPSIVLCFGTAKWTPYMKMGVILGKGKVKNSLEGVNTSGDYIVMSGEYSHKIALGVCSAAGTFFSLSDRFSVFGELKLQFMNYIPNHYITNEYTVNGVDQLQSMETDEKEVEYYESMSVDTNAPTDHTKPRQELQFSIPFNSVGFNVGIRYSF